MVLFIDASFMFYAFRFQVVQKGMLNVKLSNFLFYFVTFCLYWMTSLYIVVMMICFFCLFCCLCIFFCTNNIYIAIQRAKKSFKNVEFTYTQMKSEVDDNSMQSYNGFLLQKLATVSIISWFCYRCYKGILQKFQLSIQTLSISLIKQNVSLNSSRNLIFYDWNRYLFM